MPDHQTAPKATPTPGPWTIRHAKPGREPDIAILGNGPQPCILAECFADIRRANECATEEVQANARLIAAAPEMYEALKEAEAIITRMAHQQWQERDGGPLEGPACNTPEYLLHLRCKAAIAKAEGR